MNPPGCGDREPLATGWQACAQAPDAATRPQQLPPPGTAPWLDLATLGTAAAVLRARGEWSLDGAARDFDGEDWWFTRLLSLPAGRGNARLGFDGLATLAELWLDDTRVLVSDNMFHAHVIDLPLADQPRELRLWLRCRALAPELARRRPRPRWRTPMVRQQQLRWWRTTLLGRTPGWTPPVAPVGPWRPVWLQLPAALQLREARLLARLDGDHGHLQLEAELDCGTGTVLAGAELRLERQGRRWQVEVPLADGQRHLQAALQVEDVEPWWPHTHGEPALYRCTLALRAGDGACREFDLGAAGFRSVALVRDGDGFALQVNGVPVFCRGACWTPLDPVGLQADAADYHRALAEVRALGMNMVRVSGSLVYETPEFLRACDALGILVWQDFMFASMDYPLDDPELAASALREAREQLARWSGHPCVAVLCGNSEAEQQAAMWGTARAHWQHPFFGDTLARLCAGLCPGAPYWPSSAHGGAFPHQADAGTTSYYGVGAYLRPLEDARRSGLRFASECLAFANVPEDDAIARMPGGPALRVHHAGWKARTCRDLDAGWDFEDVRDHYLQVLFGIDPTRLRQVDHARYLALSRVASGEAMARSFGEWRRAGSGCGGALVWFLRDLWAGAGWGLLDERGGRKACAFLLARRLQPTAAWITDEGNSGLHVQLAHDGPAPLAAELCAASWSADGVPLWQARQPLALPPRSTRTVPLAALCERFEDFSWAFRFGPRSHATVAVRLEAAGTVLAEDVFLPGPPDGAPPREAGLQARWWPCADGALALELSARAPASHVHFIDANFTPPDQYFAVLPDRPRVLRLPAGSCGPEAAPRAVVAAAGSSHMTTLARAEAVAPGAS